MSFISLFLQDIVDRKLDYIEIKLIEQILPSNLSATSKQHIAILLKNDPKISSKIESLKLQIYNQIQLGSVMFINALIGLIPVPIIPGLIRTSNNVIFQMLKTGDRIEEFREIVDTSLELLDNDSTIKSFLENKGVVMEKINPIGDKNIIIQNVASSAKKAFDKIDHEYLQDGKLTPLQIYDRLNTIAAKRDTKKNTNKPHALPTPKNTRKPLALPTPKNTRKPLTLPSSKNSTKPLTLPASKTSKIKNKKQKPHHKKRTLRIKHKK
jgi:hypothetical protein